jgi:PAS domain S-box-containing protein
MSDSPTIVIVDDAAEVRQLLKARFRVSRRLEVVGEGADGAEAVALAREHQPALMLLDVSMPGMDGLQALPLVLEAAPATRVVLYSGFEEHGLVEKAIELGAATFIEKSAPVGSLIDRLLAALATGADDASAFDEAATPGSGLPESGLPESEASPDSWGSPESPDSHLQSVEESVLDEHLERFREVFEQAAIGMATMTLTGRLVRVNAALAALLRRPAEDLVGLFYGLVTDDQGDSVTAALDKLRSRPLGIIQLEHGLAAASDDRRLRATLAPVRDSRGRALYIFLQVQDITAERAAVDQLRNSEERFRLLIEAVKDYAIFMLDPTGLVVSWNTGAQRSKGYLAEEIIGQHFRVFYPPEVRARRHPEHELEMALRDGHYEEEGWRIRKDGSRFWANVLITAVFNAAGEHVGFAKVTRDNSDESWSRTVNRPSRHSPQPTRSWVL